MLNAKIGLLLSILLVAGTTAAQAGIVPTGLVAHFAGNDNAFDSSVYANNGNFAGTYAAGVFGDAFNITDYNSTYVSAPDIPAYSFSSEFTVGFWARAPGGFLNSTFVGQDNGPFNQDKWSVYYSGSTIGLHTNGTVYQWLEATQSAGLAGDTWYHIAVVKSNTDYSFYLNGAKLGATVTASEVLPDPTAPFTIGFVERNYGFNGLIDDVVLYNRVLSDGEVATLATVPEPVTLSLLALGGLVVLRRKRR